MKKLVLFLIIMQIINQTKAQTPFPCYIMRNSFAIDYSQNSGIKEYNANCWEVNTSSIYGPVLLEGNAQTTVRANKSIHLTEGFQAKNYSATGFSHFTLGNDRGAIEPFIMNLGSPVVGKHKKIEIGFKMPEEIETQVEDYLLDPDNFIGLNPYDPAKINIVAEFRNSVNSNVTTKYGFYYEYYEKQYSSTTTNGTITSSGSITKIQNNADMLKWRVRFAPTEVGFWYGTIKIYINGSFYADVVGVNFECVPSDEHGYLEIGAHHRQFRFHDDNKSFYAIGQNLTWPTTLKYLHYSNVVTNGTQSYQVANGTEEWLHTFRNLGDNGGNFARTVFYQGDDMNSPEGYAGGQEIEWEKLGDYQSRQHCMFVLDEVFDIAEQKGIFIMLTPNIQNEFSDKWAWNPYKTSSAKNANNPLKPTDVETPEDFLKSNEAKAYYKRKLRYIHARWGYGPHLAAYELISEMNGWTGYGNGDYNQYLYNWQNTLYVWKKNTLGVKQLISTCYNGSQPYFDPYFHAANYSAFDFVDFTSMHSYANKKHQSIVRQKDVNRMIDGGAFFPGWNKPTNFGEMGMTNPNKILLNSDSVPEADPNDYERCDGTEWHNALWATAFMECYGAGLNWWANDQDTKRAANFPAMKQFFSNVEFELDEWTTNQHWSNDLFETDLDEEYKATIEVFAMTTNSSHKAMGWVHQATNWWGNKKTITDCHDRNDLAMPITVKDGNDTYTSPLINYSNFQLTGLIPLTQYQVDFYRTDDGGGQWYSSETKTSNILGQLHPSYPANPTNPDASGHFYDYAFKASKSGVTFRNTESTSNNISIDTLACGTKSVEVKYIWFNDTLGLNKYEWTWGNNHSTEQFPEITFESAGNYNVVLKITFADNKSETLRQSLIIPECNTKLKSIDSLTISNSNEFFVFPNPTNNFLTIILKESANYECSIIDAYGKLIKDIKFSGKSFEIDCTDLSAGLYFVKINNHNTNYFTKFIKQ